MSASTPHLTGKRKGHRHKCNNRPQRESHPHPPRAQRTFFGTVSKFSKANPYETFFVHKSGKVRWNPNKLVNDCFDVLTVTSKGLCLPWNQKALYALENLNQKVHLMEHFGSEEMRKAQPGEGLERECFPVNEPAANPQKIICKHNLKAFVSVLYSKPTKMRVQKWVLYCEVNIYFLFSVLCIKSKSSNPAQLPGTLPISCRYLWDIEINLSRLWIVCNLTSVN